ncbi:MAG TPA: SDR family NAD(P)-dependent oxidoreductase [Opitutales bacterium]|nr:SDR family NAD(P)-dependent oxidoreductase [Opitutales bacterium]
MFAAQTVPDSLATIGAVIVTGASSGIGEEFVATILKINPKAKFFNLSRTPPKTFSNEVRLTHCPADLSTASGQESAVVAIEQWLDDEGKMGGILLINNSGFGTYGPFPEPNVERTLAMVDLNVRAPVVLTARLLPRLRARSGAVINIASTASFQPMPFFAVYAATKSFVLNWSLGLWRELLGTNVHVLCVCPGPTSTQFFRAAGFSEAPLPMNIGQTSPQVVDASLRALARKRPLVVSGWSNKLGAFVSSKLPKVWVTRITFIMMQKLRLGPLKKTP